MPIATPSAFIVNPLNENTDFAAEIDNVDLRTLTDEDYRRINDLLLKHRMLVLRNQQYLDVDTQRQFSQYWGPLQSHIESRTHLPGYPDVNLVSNMANMTDGGRIGLAGQDVESFHSDLSW